MTDRVAWLLEVSIKAGREQDFNALMGEMVASVDAEPGTVGYEWTIGEDAKTVHILEQFVDSASALIHLQGFGNYAARFVDMLDVTRLSVYGDPSGDVREGLAGFGPTFLKVTGGFTRIPQPTA